MIYLDEPYDRDSFQQFLEDQFLPNDYRPTQLQEPLISRGLIKDILNLGTVPSLDNLQIFEVIHTAKADARVTLSNEMVKYMQNNQITYALVAFVREGDPCRTGDRCDRDRRRAGRRGCGCGSGTGGHESYSD